MEDLVEILRDRSASISDRDDAAMDLSECDDAIAVLIDVAADDTENPTVLGTCGSAIAEIWRRAGIYDDDVVARLAPPARDELRASFA